jgi:carbon storage regulator
MLLLKRRIGERVVIRDDIVVTVEDIHRGYIKLSIDAPPDVLILRQELLTEEGDEYGE